MKRNLLLLVLTACFAGASWSAETPAQFGVSDDNFAFDLKLKPSVSKILPSGERYEKVPAWTPVVNMPKAPASHNKGYTLDSVVSVKPDGTPYTKQCFTYNEAGKILTQTAPLYGGGVRPHPAGARARPAQLLRLRARRRHDRPGRRNSGEEQPSLHRSEDRRGLESRRGAHPHPQPHRRHGPARPAGHPPHGRSRPL